MPAPCRGWPWCRRTGRHRPRWNAARDELRQLRAERDGEAVSDRSDDTLAGPALLLAPGDRLLEDRAAAGQFGSFENESWIGGAVRIDLSLRMASISPVSATTTVILRSCSSFDAMIVSLVFADHSGAGPPRHRRRVKIRVDRPARSARRSLGKVVTGGGPDKAQGRDRDRGASR